ncbi:MAG: extracellular solute-binding protein [Ruminococcus sp.]|nr:extracellular solute-binding protein [Ruminococcus sp.]
MRNLKKLAAAAAALTMVASLAACGNSSDDSSSMAEKKLNEDQQQTIEDIIESQTDDRVLENNEIKWFSFWDINPTASDDKDIGVDLALFQTKYNGKITYISTTWEKKFDDLAALVIAGDSPDFCGADDMDMFPKGAIKNMLDPLDDYIDFDSDLWKDVKAANDQFVYKGKHYCGVSRVDPCYIWIYNKNTIEAAGMDDPAELYANGEWNWDTMCDMCIEFTNAENDMYALDGWYYENALTQSTGKPIVGMENGEIVNYINDPDIAKVQSKMYDLQKNGVVYPKNEYGWKVRGDVFGTGLATGQTLFYPIGLWGIEDAPSVTAPYGDISAGEVMFVPVPCDPDGDTMYVPSRVHGFCLVHGAKNPEGVAAWLDCTRYAEQDEKAKSITEEQLRDDYGWTDEMIEMRENIYQMAAEHPVFEFSQGISPEISSLTDNIVKGTMNPAEATTWTQVVTENEKALNWLIDDAQSKVE